MTEFRIITETTRLWRLPLDTRELARVLGNFCRTIAAQGRPLPEQLVLRLADDGAVAAANVRSMGCAGPTNILTFPGDATLPGELLLSLDTWERECRLYRQPALSHLLRLLAHGMAHMTGLDHGPEMAALEQACLQSLRAEDSLLASEPARAYKHKPVRYLQKKVASLPAAQVARLHAARRANQIVIAGIDKDSGATLALYEKQGGAWRQLLAVPAYIGKNGLGKTAEGDKKTPAGSYRFTMAFGIAPDPGSRMAYTQVNERHYWVGDSASRLYNRFASIGDGAFDTQKSERLIDYKKAYQYCLNISYNEEGTPGKGSAIFLHCYPDNNYTEGCIAIPEDAMKFILRRVDENCVLLIDHMENLKAD